MGAADEKTGLLARSSYQDCLLNETHSAKSKGTALSLALVQIDHGRELMRQQGEAQLERHLEQPFDEGLPEALALKVVPDQHGDFCLVQTVRLGQASDGDNFLTRIDSR